MSHKKFGPDRFSRFDVYWIQKDRQTNEQTEKPNLYIDRLTLYHKEHILAVNHGVISFPTHFSKHYLLNQILKWPPPKLAQMAMPDSY